MGCRFFYVGWGQLLERVVLFEEATCHFAGARADRHHVHLFDGELLFLVRALFPLVYLLSQVHVLYF